MYEDHYETYRIMGTDGREHVIEVDTDLNTISDAGNDGVEISYNEDSGRERSVVVRTGDQVTDLIKRVLVSKDSEIKFGNAT